MAREIKKKPLFKIFCAPQAGAENQKVFILLNFKDKLKFSLDDNFSLL